MNGIEILVVIVGLIGGYFGVSKLFFDPKDPDKKTAAAGAAWHQVLEVPPDASAERIESAYRRLIQQYHPDKVESLGPELRSLAASKSQDLQRAYQEGLRARGAAR